MAFMECVTRVCLVIYLHSQHHWLGTQPNLPVVEEDVRNPDLTGWEAKVLNPWVVVWVPGEVDISPALLRSKGKQNWANYDSHVHLVDDSVCNYIKKKKKSCVYLNIITNDLQTDMQCTS